jgi:hypothetical protein
MRHFTSTICAECKWPGLATRGCVCAPSPLHPVRPEADRFVGIAFAPAAEVAYASPFPCADQYTATCNDRKSPSGRSARSVRNYPRLSSWLLDQTCVPTCGLNAKQHTCRLRLRCSARGIRGLLEYLIRHYDDLLVRDFAAAPGAQKLCCPRIGQLARALIKATASDVHGAGSRRAPNSHERHFVVYVFNMVYVFNQRLCTHVSNS